MTKQRECGPNRLVGWVGLLLCACGAAQSPGETPAAGEATADVRAAGTQGANASGRGVANAAGSSPNGTAQGNASAGAREAGAAGEERGAGVKLPSDAAFVAAPIPAGDVSRYASWKQVGQTRVGKGYLYFLDTLNDDRWLVVKSAIERDVRIVELATRRELANWPVVNLGPDEGHAVLPWRGEGEPRLLVGKQDGLWLYAAQSGQLLAQLASQRVDRLRWSDDGRVLMTVASQIPEQTSQFRLFERAGSELHLAAELPQTERVDAWALSRDNRYLARVFYPSDRVTVVDLHDGRTLVEAPAQRYVGSVEFSPDGRWLVLGGEGVKLFDLADPTRRAEYTYFYNNVGDVEFSPSGDVLAVASFDGAVRLLTYDVQSLRFELERTFAHQKNTNVYALSFTSDGNVLMSSCGDQTVRYWANPSPKALTVSGEHWRSPVQWQAHARHPAVTATPAAVASEHYTPARLSGPPAPSSIKPGNYACKISTMYKLRGCTVSVNAAGHTLLEFDKDNLLGIRGVLYDDGPVVRFEGWLTEGGGLGCANCSQQPLHAVFRGKNPKWQGLLLYRGHYDPFTEIDPPKADAIVEEAIDRFPLVLERR